MLRGIPTTSMTNRPDNATPAIQYCLEALLGVPFTEGNSIRILNNGVEIFPEMLQAIEAAEHSVDFLTFVYWQGDIAVRFAHTLAAKARQGVRVRVLLDALGAMAMSRSLIRVMQNSGVVVDWFRPPLRWRLWDADNRTHRKVLICDGKVGFTGGVGIAEQWEGDARDPSEWRDMHFRIEGPAVHGLQAAFVENWAETGRMVRSDGLDIAALEPAGSLSVQVLRTAASIHWSDIATLTQALISTARHRVRIATAYFVPNEEACRLLLDAVDRGVDVEVMMPGRYTDHRSVELAAHEDLQALLDGGVKLWSYEKTMLHSKVMTVDGEIATIGSANFNHRSMSKDDELALTVLDSGFTATLDDCFERDTDDCAPLRALDLRHDGVLRAIASHVVRPFRGQM